MLFGRMREAERKKKISEHILSLCEEGDYGICPPPLDAQTAVNELCRHFLGENYYVAMPISVRQCNAEIVYRIECEYKGYRPAGKGE